MAGYTSTNRLLTSYMESGELRMEFTGRRPPLNVWVEMFGVIIASDCAEDERLYASVTGGAYLLKSRDPLDQT